MSVQVFGEEITEVRVGVPAGLAPPLLFEGKPNETKGLVVDYATALAEAMGRKSSFSVITRYRLDGYLFKGQVDMMCYTSKVWASSQDQLDFSKPLFMKREVIIGPAPMPKKITDLKNKTIGTMLQYVYPKLDPLFASKQLIREDSLSEEANLKKLLNGRIQYIVTDEIFIDYFKLKHPKIEINRERLFMQEYPISCSLSRKGHVKVKDLNEAIDKIKANGTLEKIFSKYGAMVK
ncbi:substrate-binding periplasmic protein [uncultured Bdellovibrio sp.]|uniref:substrate-binding periplasmic protein n=1 Tax=Bdellovibrio sp. HCB-162 TaxID=3394234 RepID=UPI0025CF18A5|nr:transporter substrate-binding domain-containing protein [uncultured Bdellovibrio sp.]